MPLEEKSEDRAECLEIGRERITVVDDYAGQPENVGALVLTKADGAFRDMVRTLKGR